MGLDLASERAKATVYQTQCEAAVNARKEAEARAEAAQGHSTELQREIEGCICQGNWRQIILDYEADFGSEYVHIRMRIAVALSWSVTRGR